MQLQYPSLVHSRVVMNLCVSSKVVMGAILIILVYVQEEYSG